MALGNITILANVSGGNDGAFSLGPSGSARMLTAAIQAETIVTLSVGNNTITVPTGATVAIIIPTNPTATTTTGAYGGVLSINTSAAVAAFTISSTYPTALQWDTTQSNLYLGATTTGTISVRFM